MLWLAADAFWLEAEPQAHRPRKLMLAGDGRGMPPIRLRNEKMYWLARASFIEIRDHVRSQNKF
jgi:hypothetical protein